MHTEGSGRLRGKTGSDDRDDGDETLRDDSHNIMTEFGMHSRAFLGNFSPMFREIEGGRRLELNTCNVLCC